MSNPVVEAEKYMEDEFEKQHRPREFWLNVHSYNSVGQMAYMTRDQCGDECFKVREVTPADEAKKTALQEAIVLLREVSEVCQHDVPNLVDEINDYLKTYDPEGTRDE